MNQIKYYFLAVVMCIYITSSNAQISTNGLIAYYPFSGNVADEGPNGFDGQLFGGQFTSDVNGNSNSALQLDGINDYVNLSSFANTYRENLPELTIFFKVKFEEFGDDQTILSLGNHGESIQTNVFEVEHENNRFQVESETTSSAINNELEIDQSSNLFTNQWIDILIYLKDDSLTYCRNNEEIYKGLYIPAQTLSETLFLGCFGGDNINSCCFFGGSIDELQFYDRILPKETCPDNPVLSFESYILCENSSIIINNIEYDKEGVYEQTLQTEEGCDSILSITIEISDIFTAMESYVICTNGKIIINDIEYDKEGVYEQTLQTEEGCDSVLSITIEVSDILDGMETYSGCIDDPYSVEVGGQVFDENNPFGIVLLASEMGCDSFVEIDLVFMDCSNCSDATPGLNVQIMKSKYNTFSIYHFNHDLSLIKGDLSNKLACDHIMEMAQFYNTLRPFNKAYYLKEKELYGLLKEMDQESVMKF